MIANTRLLEPVWQSLL